VTHHQSHLTEMQARLHQARRQSTLAAKRKRIEAKKEMAKITQNLRGLRKLSRRYELYQEAKVAKLVASLPLHERQFYLAEEEKLKKLKVHTRYLYNQYLRRKIGTVSKPVFPEAVNYVLYAMCTGIDAFAAFFVLQFSFTVEGENTAELWIGSIFSGLIMSYIVSEPWNLFLKQAILPFVAATLLMHTGIFDLLSNPAGLALGAVAAIGMAGVAKVQEKATKATTAKTQAPDNDQSHVNEDQTRAKVATDAGLQLQALTIVQSEMSLHQTKDATAEGAAQPYSNAVLASPDTLRHEIQRQAKQAYDEKCRKLRGQDHDEVDKDGGHTKGDFVLQPCDDEDEHISPPANTADVANSRRAILGPSRSLIDPHNRLGSNHSTSSGDEGLFPPDYASTATGSHRLAGPTLSSLKMVHRLNDNRQVCEGGGREAATIAVSSSTSSSSSTTTTTSSTMAEIKNDDDDGKNGKNGKEATHVCSSSSSSNLSEGVCVCGMRVPQRLRDHHNQAECDRRLVVCRAGCGLEMEARARAGHEISKCRLMLCTSCDKMILRHKLTIHQNTECKGRKTTCRLGCGASLTMASLPSHELTICPYRSTTCGNCGFVCHAFELERHQKQEACLARKRISANSLDSGKSRSIQHPRLPYSPRLYPYPQPPQAPPLIHLWHHKRMVILRT
jgi:hypothetical protein